MSLLINLNLIGLLSLNILLVPNTKTHFLKIESIIDQTAKFFARVRQKSLNGMKILYRLKCRHLLFLHPEITLFTAHGESYSNVSVKYVTCSTIQEDNIWFLQDNNLPLWISELVNNSNWTKGKLNCPNCQGRLGSFDFVSGTQCQCGSHVLPPVHIVKCKVDCRNQG